LGLNFQPRGAIPPGQEGFSQALKKYRISAKTSFNYLFLLTFALVFLCRQKRPLNQPISSTAAVFSFFSTRYKFWGGRIFNLTGLLPL